MKNLYFLKYGFLVCSFFLSVTLFAQSGRVSGTVTDENDEPVPGASVVVKGTSIGTVTDLQGHYSLSGIPSGARTVVVSFIGFLNAEKQINGPTINFKLQPSATSLGEVVVVGYGTVKKSDATGAISVVSAKDFNRGAVNSIQDAVAGKIPGVVITSNSGAPGNTSTIRVRGGASLNASNDPLIVVDNVPIDNTTMGGSANVLATINPDDVESITVLKDASATAIYGARASNGVMLITTKRGTQENRLSYNATGSLSVLPKYVDNYSGDEFRDVVNRVYAGNDAATSLLGTANTNWQKEIYQDALAQDHNLSFSGTARNLPYRLSLGYNNSDGVLKTYNFSRTTLALNLDPSFLKDHLKVHINVKGLYNTNNFAEQGAIGNAVNYDPTKPVYNGNTRWRGYTTWTSDREINGPAVTLAPANPVAQLDMTDNTSVIKRSIGNVQLDYKMPFLPDLHANLNLGYDYAESKGHNNVRDSTQWVYIPVIAGGRINNYDETRKNQLIDFYLNYKKEIPSAKSAVDLTVGHSWAHFHREGNSTSSDEGMTSIQPPNKYITEYYLLSFFGRLNYTFNSKYMLTFTLREDATSRFASDKRWGLFPAAAFTWKMKEENFLKDKVFFSDLRLRLGYGTTGQQDLNNGNNYPYLAKYTIGDQTSRYQLGDNFYNTIRPDGYDANIKWESTTTLNIGLDYGILNNRITGSLDVYSRKTKDLLSIVPAAAGTNFSATVLTNVGNMENQGAEFSLNAAVIRKNNINWRIGYNISYNKNKITRLSLNDDPNNIIQVGGIAGTFNTIQAQKVGSSINSFFVYQQIYDIEGNPIESAFVDRNGDNTINSSDLYLYKKPDPTVQMGINSSLVVKHWDLSFSGRLNLGNYNYNNVASGSTYRGLYSSLGYLANQTKAAEDTKFTTALETNLSDYYIENASFFRMDNINLGYTFPTSLNNRLKLRINAGVQNVFVITKYSGLDPEISGGLDNNFFPRSRVYQMGLNCTF